MRFATFFLFLFPLALLTRGAAAAEPKLEAAAAWNRYIALTESRIAEQQRDLPNFLYPKAGSAEQRAGFEARLKSGEVIVEKLKTTDQGKNVDAPGALIHHWIGTAFIPGGNIRLAFAVLQDYDHHSVTYAPEVEKSKLISRSGDDFTAYLRFVKKKVITVVLDTYHQAHYGKIDPARAYSRSYTTKIAEIEAPGTSREREKPADEDEGFMWKMNTYWRFEERDGGLYIQCEAVTLTRNVPFGLAWVIEPFVTSIPRESLISTMVKTRDALGDSTQRPSAH
jgi:hypothetical protein